MFQLRIDWAIDIMKPFAIKKDIDEEFLIDLKIELDEKFGSEDEFEIETE